MGIDWIQPGYSVDSDSQPAEVKGSLAFCVYIFNDISTDHSYVGQFTAFINVFGFSEQHVTNTIEVAGAFSVEVDVAGMHLHAEPATFFCGLNDVCTSAR